MIREKHGEYYCHGITGHEHDIERELDLPRTPVLDYPEHSQRHRLHYEPPAVPTAPRTQRFVVWCVDHQVGIAVVLWVLVMAVCVPLAWWWLM